MIQMKTQWPHTFYPKTRQEQIVGMIAMWFRGLRIMLDDKMRHPSEWPIYVGCKILALSAKNIIRKEQFRFPKTN